MVREAGCPWVVVDRGEDSIGGPMMTMTLTIIVITNRRVGDGGQCSLMVKDGGGQPKVVGG